VVLTDFSEASLLSVLEYPRYSWEGHGTTHYSILDAQGNRVAILGTPGGSRIITAVLLGILDVAEGKEPQSWVSNPRFHHQYLPDVIEYEEGAFSETFSQAPLANLLKGT
jgi:gamma-glutamyltranspeptidase